MTARTLCMARDSMTGSYCSLNLGHVVQRHRAYHDHKMRPDALLASWPVEATEEPAPSPADIHDAAVRLAMESMHGDTSHDRIVNPHGPDRPCACGWDHRSYVAGTGRPFMPNMNAETLARMAAKPSPISRLVVEGGRGFGKSVTLPVIKREEEGL